MAANRPGYRHYFTEVRPKGDYPADYRYILVNKIADLATLFESIKDYDELALDTETTGLDHSREVIVGFSFNVTLTEGYYVPVRHTQNNIEDVTLAFDMLRTYLIGKTVFFDLQDPRVCHI